MLRRWLPRPLPLAALSLLSLVALAIWGWTARAGYVAPPSGGETARPPSGGLRVDFIDVGHGDAILITSPTGKTVLVDGGMPNAGHRVAAFVRARTNAPLDLVMLTHRHADHLGGLATVITRQGARTFMDAAFPHPSPGYDNLMRVLQDRRIPVREAERGRAVDLGGGARLVLLTPPDPAIIGSRSDVNANCLVARLEFGQVRVLLTGDAEAVTEDWLLRSKADLRADVLKLAHHGGRHSSTARFLRAVAPRIAVASAGPGDRSGTLQPETEARVQNVGARLYRTDQDGNITVWTDGRVVRVEVSGRRERAAAETGRAAVEARR
jgi:competence protein ComEC